jgi:phage/plasmid-like protein (TIGR03299 family)
MQMAHRLSKRADGTAEMVYTGEVPWHGLGTKVADAMTAKEALAMAGLNWKVLERPVAIQQADGSFERTSEFKALLRGDNQRLLHVARRTYHPLQNELAFKFADEIVDSGDAKYVTAGAIDGGKKIWMLMELSRCKVAIAGDEILPYFLFHNAHDGTSMVRGTLSETRVVCWNTLSAALATADVAGTGFSLRHTKNITANVKNARASLGLILKGHDELIAKCQTMAKQSFTDAQHAAYVEEVLPAPAKAGDEALANLRERRKTAVRLAHEGKGNGRTGVRGTWWAAYNGVTEILDHSGAWRSNENRMKDIVLGGRAVQKVVALESAFAYATGVK